MEPQSGNSTNRRILFAIGFVLFFVIIVLVWYFFYYKPVAAPSLGKTNDPFLRKTLPPRFQFLIWKDTTSSSTSVTEVTDPLQKPLVEIWNKPATGQTFITDQILKEITATTTDGTSTIEVTKTVRATSTIVVFVDKITGYIYGYPVETGKIFQISNSVVPGVHDAYFFDNGKRVLMRYVDPVKNTVVGLIATVPSINQEIEASSLENVEYLTSQVNSLAINESKTEVSYVVTTTNGSAVYTLQGTKKPELVTSSPFKDWDVSYGGNTLYITTKPSAYVEGATLTLPFFEGVVVEKTGLMSLPSSSGVILNSMWGKKGLVTFLSDSGNVKVLSFSTLASKCALSKRSLFICGVPRTIPKTTEGLPDDWFQGRISFKDDLVLVDATTGNNTKLYSFTEEDGVFDVVHLLSSPGGVFFSFNKKQNETLWLLNTNLIPEN